MENSEIRLLLLDFDGTLADTRRANTLAYVAALGEAGYTLTEEEYAAHYFGMRCNEFLTRLDDIDLTGLSWFDAGVRSFYTRRKVTCLAELQGLRLRVQ